ncbi:hypothetical protein BV22DRAFT_1129366 [Leucogyrophana mollusca]|uniref:Uncharacterized protein n=1 Tax=Leucogyrophana mollusca TaxID=85980 RepID=A0ACB8BHN6_9AGAM|nr:hypothetical protein BV22DRAFT_1129366 [Leucogyrophana mollusca]
MHSGFCSLFALLALINQAYCGPSAATPTNVASGTITTDCTAYYTVVSGDTCDLVEAKNGITAAQFLAWNPEINADCTNLELGEAYCVAASAATTTTTSSVSAATPSNVAPGTVTASCTAYHTVVSGDTCYLIEGEYGITDAQFLAWNPEINSGCTNLIIGEAYCVAST